MDEVYEDIKNEEEEKVEEKKGTLLGQITIWVRKVWIFIFDYTIPVILKDEVDFKRLAIGLVLSPVVFWLSDGGTSFFYISSRRLL